MHTIRELFRSMNARLFRRIAILGRNRKAFEEGSRVYPTLFFNYAVFVLGKREKEILYNFDCKQATVME